MNNKKVNSANKMSDTNIHRLEMLITLNYLMNKTDFDDVAKQLDICRYARKFGYKFDEVHLTGNDIRRDRIGDTLDYLFDLGNINPSLLPFTMKKSNKGKYFIENGFDVSTLEVLDLVESISTNSFLINEQKMSLINKILKVFVSNKNRISYFDYASKKINSSSSLSKTNERNLLLTRKALVSNKLISIHYSNQNSSIWCQVYDIRLEEGKIYVYFVPVKKRISKTGILKLGLDDYQVSNVDTPLIEDFNRTINDVYLNNHLNITYRSIDDYMKDSTGLLSIDYSNINL